MEQTAYFVPDEAERLLYLDPEYVTEVLVQAFREFVKQRPHAQVYHGPKVLIGQFSGTGSPARGLYGTFTSAGVSYSVHDGIILY